MAVVINATTLSVLLVTEPVVTLFSLWVAFGEDVVISKFLGGSNV
jgi:drug/metabolite transporter (DMT)-like permease